MRILALVIVLLGTVAVRSQDGECETSELGYACRKQMTDYYALHWSLGPTTQGAEADEGEVAVAMVGSTTGWVGIGFPEEAGTMAPADVVLGWVDGDDVVVNSYRPSRNFITNDDLDEDVELSDVTGMESEGNTTIQFVRSLEGMTVSIPLNKRIPVNVAIGHSDRLRSHGFGAARRQSLFVNFGEAMGREKTTSGGPRPSSKQTPGQSEVESSSPPEPSTVTSSAPTEEDTSADAPTVPEIDEPQRTGCTPSDLGYDCMMKISLVLTMHWTVGPADETGDAPEVSEGEVAMTLVGQTEGWVGIGFAETAGVMVPADAVIGWVDGSDVTVLPYRLTAREAPGGPDDTIGIRDVSGSEEGGVTTIAFVWTGDFNFDVDLTEAVDMNWAVGEDDALEQHLMYRGAFMVNLLPPLPEAAAAPEVAEPDGAEELENFEEEIPTMPMEDSDSDCPSSDLGYRCMTSLGDPVFVHWTLGPSPSTGNVPEVMDGEIAMAMVSETEGWVGISFAEFFGRMVPADAIIGWVTGTEATVTAYNITSRSVSSDDAFEAISIRETAGSEEDGVTTIRFIATGEFSFDVDFNFLININWAVGPRDSLIQHSRRGSFSINL